MKELIDTWVKFFNEGDSNGLASLYHEDAVNHQMPNDPIYGKKEIKKMFDDEFNQAEMTCIPENIFVDGDTVILEWRDPLEMKGCGFFQIFGGKIKSQRGYWDKLKFLKLHGLPLPEQEG